MLASYLAGDGALGSTTLATYDLHIHTIVSEPHIVDALPHLAGDTSQISLVSDGLCGPRYTRTT